MPVSRSCIRSRYKNKNMNTEIFRWKLGVGDPSYEGWAICILYLLASVMSWFRCRSFRESDPDYSRLWIFISGGLLFLGINKQLDLQTIISDIGRWIATELSLMEQRHIFKIVFMLLLLIIGLWFLFRFKAKIIKMFHKEKFTVLGLALLMAFIFLRATSFHILSDEVNEILNSFRFFLIFELMALMVIIFSLLENIIGEDNKISSEKPVI